MLSTTIPTLRGTPTHLTAIELYQAHHADLAGLCVRCGRRAPCSVRSHAASVIVMAGEDPRWYDGGLSPGMPAGDPAALRAQQHPERPGFGEPFGAQS